MESDDRRGSEQAKPQYECLVCQRTFVRKEHLRRHQTIHTKEKPYRCPTCGKHFSRADTIARHTAIHSQEDEVASARARSCNQCASSHVRCSRGRPCRRCVTRRFICEYTASNSLDALSPAHSEPNEDVSYVQVENSVGQTTSNCAPNGPLFDSAMSNVTADFVLANPVPSLLVHTPNAYDDAYFRDPGFSVDISQQVLSTNWWSPNLDDTTNWQIMQELMSNNIFPQVDVQMFGGGTASSLVNLPESASIQGGRAPAVLEDPSIVETLAETPLSPDSPYQTSMATSDETQSSSGRTVGRYYVDGVRARTAFPGRFHGRQSIASPGSVSIDSAFQSSSLETLSSDFLSPNSYNGVRDNLLGATSSQNKEPITTWFPKLPEMSWHIRAYFEKFHPTMPFLRKAIFQDPKIHWLLTFAVATVGAQYTAPESARKMRDMLSEALQRQFHTSHWQDEASAAGSFSFVSHPGRISHLSLQVVQAAILNTLAMLHSGDDVHTRRDRALLEKSRLVEMCDSNNLLDAARESNKWRQGNNANGKVEEWLEHQSFLRTGLTIWLLDAIFSYEVNSQPRMTFLPVNTPLPCSEKTWECPSEESIAAEESDTVSFSHALEILYMEKKLPRLTSDFAHILLIHAICRRTKDVFFRAQSQLSFWTPSAAVQSRIPAPTNEESWPPSHEMCVKWRNSACDSLDILHWKANGRIAESAGWEHSTVLHLHLARLIILTPTVHLQTLAANPMILGSPSTSMSQDGAARRRDTARKHLIEWATQDQYKARLSVIHAGALFWHIRRYSVNNMLEPFAAYMATLVIWAYSVVLVSTKASILNGHASNSDMTLDSGSNLQRPIDTQVLPESPVEEAEIEPSLIYIDRPCDDEMVQTFARVGNKMTARMHGIRDISAPGAPKRILQEGIHLLSSPTSNLESQGRKFRTPQQEDLPPVWGIQKQYLESLTWLESKS